MNLRESLIVQSPSLELQRAAADEIARLDSTVRHLATIHYETQAQLGNMLLALRSALDYDIGQNVYQDPPGRTEYNRLLGFIQAAINCAKKETA